MVDILEDSFGSANTLWCPISDIVDLYQIAPGAAGVEG